MGRHHLYNANFRLRASPLEFRMQGVFAKGFPYALRLPPVSLSTCCRLDSRFPSVLDSGGRFFESFAPLLAAVLFSAAFRASRSFFSFSRRRALDSNSCQSPSIC